MLNSLYIYQPPSLQCDMAYNDDFFPTETISSLSTSPILKANHRLTWLALSYKVRPFRRLSSSTSHRPSSSPSSSAPAHQHPHPSLSSMHGSSHPRMLPAVPAVPQLSRPRRSRGAQATPSRPVRLVTPPRIEPIGSKPRRRPAGPLAS